MKNVILSKTGLFPPYENSEQSIYPKLTKNCTSFPNFHTNKEVKVNITFGILFFTKQIAILETLAKNWFKHVNILVMRYERLNWFYSKMLRLWQLCSLTSWFKCTSTVARFDVLNNLISPYPKVWKVYSHLLPESVVNLKMQLVLPHMQVVQGLLKIENKLNTTIDCNHQIKYECNETFMIWILVMLRHTKLGSM